MTTETLIIETQNLNFSFRKNEKFIENLNLKVPKGSIYGFLGANGAGKSTTIRLLTSLIKSKNSIKLFGNDLNKVTPNIYSKIGVLIEDASLYQHLNARENLSIVCNYQNITKDRIDEVLTIVGLDDTNKKIKHFSMGMKQRLGLAIALLPNPELLILDEPVNGLDPQGIREIRELLIELNKKNGTTIFLSSHILSEIEKTCTHVGIISNGKLKFQGKLSDLEMQKNATLIETSNSKETIRLIEQSGKIGTMVNDKFVAVNFDDKNEIPNVIEKLVNQNIQIFSVESKQETLEEWFLEITQ